MAWRAMLLLVFVGPARGFSFLDGWKGRQARSAAERVVLERYPGGSVRWEEAASVAARAEGFWRWVDGPGGDVLGFHPELGGVAAHKLVDQAEACRLPIEAVDGVGESTLLRKVMVVEGGPPPELENADLSLLPSPASTRAGTERFVDRVLVGLRQCPFTASRDLAGVGLEDLGVVGAPILYAHSDATTVPGLLADTWRTLGAFLAAGEAGYSSILLTAPYWDGSFDAWKEAVFPLLEDTVVDAGLSRTLGLVCFHNAYATPDPRWLARHRFGHQYAPQTLRRFAADVDADFAETVTDDDLHFYGSYMRRTPHACINVLWSSQLEAAETKRESKRLYVRNIKRLMERGRGALDREQAQDRVTSEEEE